jgi:hypothetical protein
MVQFQNSIMNPRWFKESIDGVVPVSTSVVNDDFDPDYVHMECECGGRGRSMMLIGDCSMQCSLIRS